MESRKEIDRILSEEEIVSPSSDFTARVMRQVRTEAAAPEPIEFPWRRFLPGVLTSLSLVMGTFAAMSWLNAGGAGEPPAPPARTSWLVSGLEAALASPTGIGLTCAIGTLALSAGIAWWAMRSGGSHAARL